MTIAEIAKKHDTSWGNIKLYQHNREAIQKNLEDTNSGSTRPANLKYPQVDTAMLALVNEMLDKGGNLSGRLLRYTAQKYADNNNIDGFRSSNGWLQKFCQRHELAFGVLQGKFQYTYAL